MYDFSNNTSVVTDQQASVHIECRKYNDHRFIQYDNIETNNEMMTKAQGQYGGNKLPCEDIHRKSGNISCVRTYKSKVLNFSKLIDVEYNDNQCFWITVSSIFDPVWECADVAFKYPQYKQSIYLNINQSTNRNSKLFQNYICKGMFDTINAIIENTLGYFDKNIMNNLLAAPTTNFRNRFDPYNGVNCQNNLDIQLETYMVIKSPINNHIVFNKLFINNTRFINEATQLISKLLGVQVLIMYEVYPTLSPTISPTALPNIIPSVSPIIYPTASPTIPPIISSTTSTSPTTSTNPITVIIVVALVLVIIAVALVLVIKKRRNHKYAKMARANTDHQIDTHNDIIEMTEKENNREQLKQFIPNNSNNTYNREEKHQHQSVKNDENMGSIHYALVLSICIESYPPYSRDGCQVDVKNITKTFGDKGWGYQIIQNKNKSVSKKECKELLKKAKNELLKNNYMYDGFLFFCSA
eukprot:49910_1